MDRFIPRFLNLRLLGEGWVYMKILKIFWGIIKWSLYICALTVFWMIITLSLMYHDYLVQLVQVPEQSEIFEVVRQMMSYITPSGKNLIILIVSNFVLNLIFNFVLRCGLISYRKYHYTSAVIGYLLLQINYCWQNMILIVGFIMIILLLVRRVKILVERDIPIIRPIYVVSLTLIGVLCLGELFFPYPHDWQACRRIMMIMTMKTISISMEEYFIKRTTCAELMGYLLSPATVLFGPWISLETYTIYYIRHMKLNWKWAVKIAELFNYAMIHLALINYFDAYLIPVLTIRSWNVAFIVPKVTQNAFAFRASNYYVGYMAEFTMITAGFNAYHHFDPQQRWRYPVTRALTVEFPRSMDVAVQNWNIPAYHFLVQNIYSPFAEINKTSAVLMSFLVTMLIHGLNIRTTVVLLSLGIWTYTQEIIQDKLAMRLSSCCRIYACRAGCGHRLKFWHPITLVINGINMFLNILHLVFTGHIMHKDFDGSTVWDLCRIWRHDFGLLSHLIIVIWFCFMLYVA